MKVCNRVKDPVKTVFYLTSARAIIILKIDSIFRSMNFHPIGRYSFSFPSITAI